MKTFEQLAKESHDVFRRHIADNLDPEFAPSHWQDLMQDFKDAWIAATRHIVEQFNQVH